MLLMQDGQLATEYAWRNTQLPPQLQLPLLQQAKD